MRKSNYKSIRWRKLLTALALALALTSHAFAEAVVDADWLGAGREDMPRATATPEPSPEPTQASEAARAVEVQSSSPNIPTATLSPKVAELPWNLMLVNAKNPVPDDWEVDLVTLSNGRKVDRRILPDLQRMFDDCRAQGLLPIVYTAYRSYDDQKDMLALKYRQYKNQGMSHEDAQIAALKVANYPGYSEHQLGLAVDIDSADTSRCSNESVWNWMKRHCQEYGFIWRYPGQRSDITGISNEDWHFRYVGVEAATYMMTNLLTLEEYLQEFYDIPY